MLVIIVVAFQHIDQDDKRIRIWCPSGSIDDSTLEGLPGDLTLEGMKTEIGNLDSMQCGDLLTESELGDLRKQCRVIPSRWVTTRKERVFGPCADSLERHCKGC